MRLNDDDYEFDNEDYDYDEEEDYEVKEKKPSRRERKKEEEQQQTAATFDISEKQRQKQQNKITPINRNRRQGQPGMEVCVIKPTTIEDEIEITETLLNGRTVVINMEGLSVDIAQRIIDFTSGATFAMHGNLQKLLRSAAVPLLFCVLCGKVFFLLPHNPLLHRNRNLRYQIRNHHHLNA